MAIPFAEAQLPAPSALIELFELQLFAAIHGVNDVYRFHAGINAKRDGPVVWAGNTYEALPIAAEGFAYTGTGPLPRPTLRVANLPVGSSPYSGGLISGLLLSLPSGLEGAKVTRLRAHARHLDAVNFPGNVNPLGTPDPTAEYSRQIYYIDQKKAENLEFVEFELRAQFDLASVRAPRFQVIAICQFQYRQGRCPYNGNLYFNANGNPVASLALDVCGKRFRDCKLRFAQISALGAVTTGSNVLALDAAVNLETGALVAGFGVPTGTTMTSMSGTTLTMSAVATATTTTTKTGTLQANRYQLTVANATGLAVGMTISGPKIPANATIESILGTTIGFSPPVNIEDVLGLQFTRTGELWRDSDDIWNSTSNVLELSNYSGVTAGLYVTGPTLPLSNLAVVQSFNFDGQPVISYSAATAASVGTYSFYAQQAQTSQTYTFTVTSRQYSFRADSGLPFGAFPGAGTVY